MQVKLTGYQKVPKKLQQSSNRADIRFVPLRQSYASIVARHRPSHAHQRAADTANLMQHCNSKKTINLRHNVVCGFKNAIKNIYTAD